MNAQKELSMAEGFIAAGQYTKALEQLKAMPETEMAVQMKVEVLVKTGEIDAARELVKSIKNSNQRKLQNALVLQYLGSYDLAIDSLNSIKLKTIVDSNFKYNHIKALGINHWLNGDFSEAELYLTKYYVKYPNLAASCNNLGILYLSVNASKAEEFFRKGLALSTGNTNENGTLLDISLNNNLALSLKQQGKHEEALGMFLQSQNMLQNNHDLSTILAFVEANISQIYFEKKNTNQAIFYCNKAIGILEGFYKTKHPEISRLYNLLASYYSSLNKLPKVEEYLFRSYSNNSNSEVLQSPNEIYRTLSGKKDKKLAIETMLLHADYFESLYYRKNPKLTYLEKAIELYINADSILTEVRRNTKLETDKLAMAKLGTNLCDNAIRTCLKLREYSFKKDHYFQLAYQFSENSKSRVLLEAINESKIKSFANLPDSVLSKEQNLKAQISYYESNKLQIKNADMILEQLYATNKNLLSQLAVQYPQYYELKYGANKIIIKDLQNRLSQDETVLNYYISDKEYMVVFVVSQKDIHVFQVSTDQQLERKIIGLRNSIAFNDPKLFAKCVNYLNDKLLFIPITPKQQLIIVPDPKLGNLPFEVLLKKDINKSNNTYFGLNYLVKEHAISYQYSTTLLLNELGQTYNYRLNALLCSPVEYENGLSTLNGAEKEVVAVDSVLKKRDFVNKILLHTTATETNVKAELVKAFKYVMISSHGVVNDNSPDKSQVFLKKDNLNDGNLMTAEIYKLRINTKLMLLTCCQTGLGKLMKGEGVMGFSRALLYAGSRNMVLSLWNVSDRFSVDITREMMINMEFKGQNMAIALQSSKINLIKSQESSNPYSWAAYILVGK